MRIYKSVFILLLTIGCSQSSKTSESDREYTLLEERKDSKNRVIKTVESGWISGEDIWLKISCYDTLGNKIEEYGAKPYGNKYKKVFNYDDQNRLVKVVEYSFEIEFENYGLKDGYSLEDTLADFTLNNDLLRYKVVYSFDERIGMINESHYDFVFDSLRKIKTAHLSFDTLYKSNIRLEEVVR